MPCLEARGPVPAVAGRPLQCWQADQQVHRQKIILRVVAVLCRMDKLRVFVMGGRINAYVLSQVRLRRVRHACSGSLRGQAAVDGAAERGAPRPRQVCPPGAWPAGHAATGVLSIPARCTPVV